MPSHVLSGQLGSSIPLTQRLIAVVSYEGCPMHFCTGDNGNRTPRGTDNDINPSLDNDKSGKKTTGKSWEEGVDNICDQSARYEGHKDQNSLLKSRMDRSQNHTEKMA